MKKQNKQLHNDPWDRDFYETGSTQPPKNRGGLVAILLVVVIVLCGVITFLGVTNIRLFHMLQHQRAEGSEPDYELVEWDAAAVPSVDETRNDPDENQETPVRLGLKCVTVSNFDQEYYLLPSGCLVMEVMEGTPSEHSELRVGDVIVSLNGSAVQSVQALQKLLLECASGEEVDLEVYRSQTENCITVKVTLE